MTQAFRLTSITLIAGLGACGLDHPARLSDGLRIQVAPLSLPYLSKVCYDLRVTNGPDGTGEKVWDKGQPGLNGGTPDVGALCSTQYGDSGGGAITYVGPCDADGPGGERMNSVTLWFDGLYDTSGAYIAPDGPEGWQNPCVDGAGAEVGCTLNVPCRENADSAVDFDLTIMRQANQGFFDVGVNFDDIFCSAKVDCAYPATQSTPARPIELVFDPATNQRVQSVVWAFACTDGDPSGASTATATHLYMDDLVLDCVDSAGSHVRYTIPAAAGPGNLYSTTSVAPPPLVQAMVFEGKELIRNGELEADKLYWNVVLGLNASFFAPASGMAPTCTLETRATASKGPLAEGVTPINANYPYVDVSVPLNSGSLITCSQHPLNGEDEHAGVATRYTGRADDGSGFARQSFGNVGAVANGLVATDSLGSTPLNPCLPNPCAHQGACTVSGLGFACACEPAWDGATCELDRDGCAVSPCFDGVVCTDVTAPAAGFGCGECPMGYNGDGQTCTPNGIPTGEPYLAYTSSTWDAETHHGLDAIYGESRWQFPYTYYNAALGTRVKNLASERVIYRDTQTGAEVWIIARSKADEDVFYTNNQRVNSNGSKVRVAALPANLSTKNNPVACTTGAFPGSAECPRFDMPKATTVRWDPSNPSRYFVDYASSPLFGRYHLTLGGATVPTNDNNRVFAFPPGAAGIPDLSAGLQAMMIQVFNPPTSPATKAIIVYRDQNPTADFPEWGPALTFPICSRSVTTSADEMGSSELTTVNGVLHARYSLNKGHNLPNDPTPYQNYMFPVTMDAPDDCQGGIPAGYVDLLAQENRNIFQVPASEWPDGGHGGISPSRSFMAIKRTAAAVVGPNGSCKGIDDFRAGVTRNGYFIEATIPKCDHMDWTVDDSFFYVWARMPGTPIYRVENELDTAGEIKARNVFRVVAAKACRSNYDTDVYHNASPDGTKVIFHSNMLSDRECPEEFDPPDTGPLWHSKEAMKDTRDLFMAIVEYPKPPASLEVTQNGQGAYLTWPVSTRVDLNLPNAGNGLVRATAKETAGYHVYRSQRSGEGFARITDALVAQPVSQAGSVSFTDPTPGPTPHYVVTAVDHASLESRVFSPEAAPTWGPDVRIFWEAEEGRLVSPMREVFLPSDCSANFAIARAFRRPDWSVATGAASATWKVRVPAAGSYRLWVRARSRTGAPAQGQFGFDGGSGFTLNAVSSGWSWILVTGASVNDVDLAAGDHVVALTTSESALEVDKLLLTTEAAPQPTGFGNTPEFDMAAAVSWGSVRPSSEVVAGTLSGPMSAYFSTCSDTACKQCINNSCTQMEVSGVAAILEWDAFPGRVHHYQVYRGTRTSPPTSTQNHLVGSPSKPSFVDPNLPTGEYLYIVVAVDSWGQRSKPSAPVCVASCAGGSCSCL